MNVMRIDFEYYRPEERHPTLVCAALQINSGEVKTTWLHKDKRAQKKLYNYLVEARNAGFIFASYAVTAEARCFSALGLDPTTCQWKDLYVEWRQLRNCYDKYNYGTYFIGGFRRHSVPPVYNRPHLNEGKDNKSLDYSLDACVARLLKKNIDAPLKHHMRRLILSAADGYIYTAEDRDDILEYCKSDIVYLEQIDKIMTSEIAAAMKKTEEEILPMQLKRGEFAAHVALLEDEGIPLDMEAAQNLRRNVDLAKNTLIEDLVKNHYPFFVKKKTKILDLKPEWRDTYKNFEEFVHTKMPEQVAANWKRTESGRLATDDDYLHTHDGVPEIAAYRQVKKLLNQLKWFRVPDEGDKDFFSSVGKDGRLRTFFGIYGTQTARNAPKAKEFIFAMSAWLRCLIRPPKGYVITELDYGSQEFAIAAILSKDPVMIAAYQSGDPYLFFAKKAKAVPPNGTKAEYSKERNLFKSTTLGLQYGMGSKSLSVKLTSDMGEVITQQQAEKLIELHKRTYRIYWRWLGRIEREYSRNGYLSLPCGWALFKDNPAMLSVRNFPTQGSGSSVIREAVRLLKINNIRCLATLHDAVYIISPEDRAEEEIKQADYLLRSAFNDVLGQTEVDIRIDQCSHKAGEVWVSEKGKSYYELLKKYLKYQETGEELLSKMRKTIFS